MKFNFNELCCDVIAAGWAHSRAPLQIQILAMEDKDWTYEDLAKAVGTTCQNIWRDLKNGGLHKASLDRVDRIAAALGLCVHHFLISHKNEKKILPKLQKLLKAA